MVPLETFASTPDQAFQMTAYPGEPRAQACQPTEPALADLTAYWEWPAPFYQA